MTLAKFPSFLDPDKVKEYGKIVQDFSLETKKLTDYADRIAHGELLVFIEKNLMRDELLGYNVSDKESYQSSVKILLKQNAMYELNSVYLLPYSKIPQCMYFKEVRQHHWQP